MTPIQTTAKSAPIDEPPTNRASLVGVMRRPPHAPHPRLGFARLAVLAWCALGLVAVGVSPAVAQPARSGPDRAGLASSIRWRSCGVRLDCARVRVPLNWAHPAGPKITLAVIRHVASRPDRRMGPMFVNGGGASGSVELVRSEGARLDALGQGRFDVVGWALRGGAGAEPMVRCFADQRTRERFWDGLSIPTTRAQSLAYLPKTVAYARRCGALGGRLLPHVSSTDDARDLDYLRRCGVSEPLIERATFSHQA
jgi:hypothetical protein